MTCLDTDFIIDLLRRKPAAESKLEEMTADGDKLTTTPLNASELYKGAYNSSWPIEEAKKVRHLLDTLDILEFST
jgi:tRNA(fMet)-specific endonuclease VapC